MYRSGTPHTTHLLAQTHRETAVIQAAHSILSLCDDRRTRTFVRIFAIVSWLDFVSLLAVDDLLPSRCKHRCSASSR
jgi:hypothetical protein